MCVDASEVEGWVFKKLKALKAGSLSRRRRSCGSLVRRLPTSDPQVKAIWEPAEHRRWGTLPLPLPLAIPSSLSPRWGRAQFYRCPAVHIWRAAGIRHCELLRTQRPLLVRNRGSPAFEPGPPVAAAGLGWVSSYTIPRHLRLGTSRPVPPVALKSTPLGPLHFAGRSLAGLLCVLKTLSDDLIITQFPTSLVLALRTSARRDLLESKIKVCK